MTETPPPLDLDGVGWYEVTRWLVRADDAEAKVERQRDRLRARERQVRRLRAEVTRLHALVADLRATASPAWDEEAVLVALVDAHLASVRQVMEDGYPSIFVRSNEDAADAAFAVVRDHLPVKPSREDVYRPRGRGVVKLYVWRSSWNGMWYVSRDPKPETPYAAYMRRHHDKHFWTHRQAFTDAWARTHPKED